MQLMTTIVQGNYECGWDAVIYQLIILCTNYNLT